MAQGQDPVTIRELIQRARNGDDDAFGDLFAHYRVTAYRLCLQQFGDPVLAEDAVQDAFGRARAALATFDTTKRFFPWLASITLNRAVDLWRRDARCQAVGLSVEEQHSRTTDATWEAVVQGQDRDRLRQALSALSPKQRRVLLLHDLDGVPYDELAEAEGTSEVAARSLVCRARATMRSVLQTVTLVLWSIRRRVVARLHRMWNTLTQNSERIVYASSVAVTIAVATMSALPHHPEASEVPTRRGFVAFAGHQGIPAALVERVVRPRQVASTNHTRVRWDRGSDGPVRWHANVEPPRSGATAPSSGKLGFEVVGPDGEVIYSFRTWIDCDDGGQVPKNAGPIQRIC